MDLANLHAAYDFSVLEAMLFNMVHAFSCAVMFCGIMGKFTQLVFASLRLIFAKSLAPIMWDPAFFGISTCLMPVDMNFIFMMHG